MYGSDLHAALTSAQIFISILADLVNSDKKIVFQIQLSKLKIQVFLKKFINLFCFYKSHSRSSF